MIVRPTQHVSVYIPPVIIQLWFVIVTGLHRESDSGCYCLYTVRPLPRELQLAIHYHLGRFLAKMSARQG